MQINLCISIHTSLFLLFKLLLFIICEIIIIIICEENIKGAWV